MRTAVVLSMLVILLSSCKRGDELPQGWACKRTKVSNVCRVPFEAILADRDAYVGRDIQLEGILLVGTRENLRGVGDEIALLFASEEKLKTCNLHFAIRILPSTKISIAGLRGMTGRLVSLAGEFSSGDGTNLGTLKAEIPPSIYNLEVIESACMAPMPDPPLPPQES